MPAIVKRLAYAGTIFLTLSLPPLIGRFLPSFPPEQAESHRRTATNIVVDHTSTIASLNLPKPSNNNSGICYYEWEEFIQTLSQNYNHHQQQILSWTVSGGLDYRYYLTKFLARWRLLDLNLLVIAMDMETALVACQAGYDATLWTRPQQSYSRVADVKFQVSAELASRGITQFFLELDVFCKENPLQHYSLLSISSQQPESGGVGKQNSKNSTELTLSTADLIITQEGINTSFINIGMYFVKPMDRTAKFFQALTQIMSQSLKYKEMHSYNASTNKNKGPLAVRPIFDQDVFEDCLRAFRFNSSYYTPDDIMRQVDLLAPCKQPPLTSLKVHVLPYTEIQSKNIPIISKSTICLHALGFRGPFESLHTKLMRANYFGFDPIPFVTDPKPMLQMKYHHPSSERQYDIWCNKVFEIRFPTDNTKEHKIAVPPRVTFLSRPAAILCVLAKYSNRTVVFPPFVPKCRGSISESVWSFDRINVQAIHNMWDSWRYLLPEDLKALESSTKMVQLPNGGLQQALANITELCKGSYLCTIDGLYKDTIDDSELLDTLHGLLSHMCVKAACVVNRALTTMVRQNPK